jgi:hypothetical protein
MRKLLGISLLTALVLVATERPAHAWINCKWSVGFNWQWQSGGNNLLWGLFRNGQVPGPWGDGVIPGYCSGPAPAPAYPYAPPLAGPAPAPVVPHAPPAAHPVANPVQQAWQFNTVPNWTPGQNVYQAASQQPSYQPAPAYNYAGYGYGGYDYYGGGGGYANVPSYWYGR